MHADRVMRELERCRAEWCSRDAEWCSGDAEPSGAWKSMLEKRLGKHAHAWEIGAREVVSKCYSGDRSREVDRTKNRNDDVEACDIHSFLKTNSFPSTVLSRITRYLFSRI